MTPLPENQGRAACLFCERQPAATRLGLCARCHAIKGVRRLYLRRHGWTPAWEAHLRRLAERARLRLPLFPRPDKRKEKPDDADRS